MRSKLRLNKKRKENLLFILITLFPEYNYFSINKKGTIRFRKNWMSLGRKINIHELVFTEISDRLSAYRQGSQDYRTIYNDEMVDIISTGRMNLIDYLYQEFLNIRKLSKEELLAEKTHLQLKNAEVVVTIGEIIPSFIEKSHSAVQNGWGETCKFLKRISSLEEKRRTSDRFRFAKLNKI